MVLFVKHSHKGLTFLGREFHANGVVTVVIGNWGIGAVLGFACVEVKGDCNDLFH